MGLSYNISMESPPLYQIHEIGCTLKIQTPGIGKMLIEKAKQWNINKGVNKLRLRCNIK